MRDLSRWVAVSVAPALVFAGASTASAQVLSEADAVARALAGSPQLRAARARPTQVAAEERARRAYLNPSVTLQQEDAAGVRDRFLLVEQPFSVSGRRGLLAKAATHAIAASEADVRDLEHVVRRDTRVAYAHCVVFVQASGETFERRPVTPGARDAGFVAVDGVKVGERVVVRGAPLVRLASLSTQVPAHGHVH